jgi:hypothetical protein
MSASRTVWNGSEPAVDQGKVNGFQLTWDPDDSRFYVHDKDEDETVLATFRERRNAVYFARCRT